MNNNIVIVIIYGASRSFLVLLLSILPGISFSTDEILELKIGFLNIERELPAALSNLDPIVRDRGTQGARLAMEDNNTTGRFTHQHFVLKEHTATDNEDLIRLFRALIKEGFQFFITSLPDPILNALAVLPEANQALFFDIETQDDSLRRDQCRVNVLHLLPSRAMRADALAQYMLKKRWKRWFLIIGPTEQDQLYAQALKRAAKRFGMTIIQEKIWSYTHDARRTAQAEVPTFTQVVDHDVVVVADEDGLFGEYLSYRTWIPRPVAGTQGLTPTAWHRTHEQWGAVQLQNRFRELSGRWMTEEDYAAWLSGRAMGEAATRKKSVDFAILKEFILSDEFALAGFKGTKLSFRSWNGQLRQPVLLSGARSMVAVAPLEGFLHPKNPLDSLGYDEPESLCAGL